jgi:hypothetical protein
MEDECMRSAEELEGLALGGLDVDALEVVPSLLEERGQEVDSHEDVLSEFLLGHLLVADGDGHAGDLLELELDGGTAVVDLGAEVLTVGDDLGEHADSVQDGSEDGGDLLDEGVGGEEQRVLLGPLLDELLVLVEGLEAVELHHVDLDALGLHDVAMLGVSDQADLQAGAGDVGETDGPSETLVLLGVVVLEADLELDSLGELASLLVLEDGRDGLRNLGVGDVLACHTFFFLR